MIGEAGRIAALGSGFPTYATAVGAGHRPLLEPGRDQLYSQAAPQQRHSASSTAEVSSSTRSVVSSLRAAGAGGSGDGLPSVGSGTDTA